MNVSQVSTLLALLSFVALAIAVAVFTLLATGQKHRLMPIRDLLVPLAFVIALTATLGSLYYSGVMHFRPCRLCWWQRISMYPLVPVLAVGMLRRDRSAAWYGLPLAVIGLGWSIYHKQLQWFPEQGTSCDADASCTSVWVDTFGFVSIPFMAGAGFIAITALLIASIRIDSQPSATTSELESAQ